MLVFACDMCKKTNLEVSIGFYTKEYTVKPDPKDPSKIMRSLISLRLSTERSSIVTQSNPNIESSDICTECASKTSQLMLESGVRKPIDVAAS
jgi:hypothetical protein